MANDQDKTRQLFHLIAGISPENEEYLAKIVKEQRKAKTDFQALEKGTMELKQILLEGQKFINRVEPLFFESAASLQNEFENKQDLTDELKQLEQISRSLQEKASSLSSYIGVANVQVNKLTEGEDLSFTILKKNEAEELFQFLINDEFETDTEYMNRVQTTIEKLGWFQIGKVRIKKIYFNLNEKMMRLYAKNHLNSNVKYEEWTSNVSLWKLHLFEYASISSGLPEYLKITNIDRDTAKRLYENQSEEGYPLVIRIDLNQRNQKLVVNNIQLVTDWKVFDVQETDSLYRW